jgi:hypothetical protein
MALATTRPTTNARPVEVAALDAHSDVSDRSVTRTSGDQQLAADILRTRVRERCHPNKQKPRRSGAFVSGRYWARTSDPQLVELVLSQLS